MKSVVAKSLFALVVVGAVWLGYCLLDDEIEEQPSDRKERVVQRTRISSIERALLKKQLGTFMHTMTQEARRRVRVSGTVRESGTGIPLASAEVAFIGEGGESTAFSGRDGRYDIVLLPGVFRILASAKGHVAVGLSPRRESQKTPSSDDVNMPRLDLTPVVSVTGNLRGVDIRLRTSATIKGTVRDMDGQPVHGAIVASNNRGRRGVAHTLLGRDVAESDSTGAFEIIVPSGAVNLTASHYDFAGLSEGSPHMLFTSAGDTHHVDLTLVDGCIISGQVVDSSGAAFEQGAMELWTGDDDPHEFSHAGMFAGGQFRFVRTEAGPIRLRAWPWRASPAPAQEFACEDGDLHEDVIFVSSSDSPDLEGTLRSLDGEPIAGARLFITPLEPGGMSQWEESDADGEWSVYSLPAGKYLVSTSAPGHGMDSKTVTVPSSGLDLVLSGTGSISGTVSGVDNGSFTFTPKMCLSDFHGEHGRRFPIPLGIGIKQDTRLVLIEDGLYHIDNLPACDLRGVAASNDRVESIAVSVLEDQNSKLPLTLGAP